MIIRRAEVQVTFILNFSPDEPFDKLAKRAREFLVKHAETIPLLYKELEFANEKKENSRNSLY